MFQDLEQPSTPGQEAGNGPEIGDVLNFIDNVYFCGPCKIQIEAESDFRAHLESHAYDCLYHCLYCPALSSDTSSIGEHIEKEHPSKENYYGCLVYPSIDQIMQSLHTEKTNVKEKPSGKSSSTSSKKSAAIDVNGDDHRIRGGIADKNKSSSVKTHTAGRSKKNELLATADHRSRTIEPIELKLDEQFASDSESSAPNVLEAKEKTSSGVDQASDTPLTRVPSDVQDMASNDPVVLPIVIEPEKEHRFSSLTDQKNGASKASSSEVKDQQVQDSLADADQHHSNAQTNVEKGENLDENDMAAENTEESDPNQGVSAVESPKTQKLLTNCTSADTEITMTKESSGASLSQEIKVKRKSVKCYHDSEARHVGNPSHLSHKVVDMTRTQSDSEDGDSELSEPLDVINEDREQCGSMSAKEQKEVLPTLEKSDIDTAEGSLKKPLSTSPSDPQSNDKSGASTQSSITDVIAMIQGLNDEPGASDASFSDSHSKEKSMHNETPDESVSSPSDPKFIQPVEKHTSEIENLSEGMFIITNVVSGAPDIVDCENNGGTAATDIPEELPAEPANPEGRDDVLEQDTSTKKDECDEEITEDDTSFVVDKVYSGSDGDIEIRTHPSENCHSGDHAEANEKDGRFLFNNQKVSRAWPYLWNKSRKQSRSSPPLVDQDLSGKVYVCSFFKCSFWVAYDAASFKIHNLLHHAEAKTFTCGFCPKSFCTDDMLMTHMDATHTDSSQVFYFKSYHCGFKDCWFVCGQEAEFLDHNRKVHFNSVSYPCCFCKQSFQNVADLVLHVDESVTYSCALCPGVLTSTYADILEHVSSSFHASMVNSSGSVDSLIQLYLTCILSNESGEIKYKTINRFVPNSKSASTPPVQQETFKCTICSLETSDEAYFEKHVVQCMKNQAKRPRPVDPCPPKPTRQIQEPEQTLEATSMAVTKDPVPEESCQTKALPELSQADENDILADPEIPALAPGMPDICTEMKDQLHTEVIHDEDSLPELDPPLLEAAITPPPPPKKTVLQSLGKGSLVVCDKCSFKTEFRVVKAIHERVHMYSQDKTKLLWCPHCSYSTDVALYFKIHVQGHTEKTRIRLYHCAHCTLSSNQMDLVEDHHEEVHPDLDLKSEVTRLVLEDLQCPDCPTSLKNETEFLEHLEEQHNDSSVQKYLKEMYSIASLQIVDENKEQNEEGSEVDVREKPKSGRNVIGHITEELNETEEDPQEGSDRFQCPSCSYSCFKCGTWVRHLQRHHRSVIEEILLYCCKTCKWKSTSKRKTIDHCKLRHNEIILEVQTMELSSNLAPLIGEHNADEHQENVPKSAGISRYHCEFCDFSTNDKATLEDHWATHEGQTAFSAMDEEDDDEGIDDEEPSFVVTEKHKEDGANCDNNSLTLIEDMLYSLKGDERRPFKQPIRCPICPYTTVIKKNMRRHLNFHKKQAYIKNGYKCAYCPYISEIEGVVTRHINKHHPTLPVKKIAIGRARLKDDERVTASDAMLISSAGPATEIVQQGSTLGPSKDGVFKTPQQCPKCDYVTKLEYNLILHMKTHMEEQGDLDVEGHNGDFPMSWNKTIPNDEAENSGLTGITIASVVGSVGSEDVMDKVHKREEGNIVSQSELEREDEVYCNSMICTKVDGKALYKCKKCVFMDSETSKIYNHFCKRHREHCPFQCGYCEYRSVTVVKIQQHCKASHGNLTVKVAPVLDDTQGEENTVSTDSYSRTVTADLIEDESTLDDETVEQTYDDWLSSYMIKCGNNVHMCNICGYEQKGTAALKRHVLAVHLRYYPYKCKHCAFSAVEANKVLKHTDKNHPTLDRKIIRRKIPDDLPQVVDCEKEDVKPDIRTLEINAAPKPEDVLNVKIKEEPVSDPEPENHNEGMSDSNHDSDNTIEGSDYNGEGVRVKQEPEDDYPDSDHQVRTRKYRKDKYPRLYSKTYRCTVCNYMSRWNLADVKLHVLSVHLRIHPYSCRYCCFGCPRRGKLMEHYASAHPELPASADQAREEVQSALSVVEDGHTVFIGLSENAPAIEQAYQANVKPRTPKAPGANVGGRPKSSSSRLSSPSPGPSSPAESLSKRNDSSGSVPGKTRDQPLDLSFRTTPPPMRSSLVPGRNTQVLKVPTTLRIPTVQKSYSPSPEQPPQVSPPAQSKKKEYTLYKCRSCGRGYVQKIKAQYHFALKHLNLHPYICNYCSYGGDARKRVVEHILQEHPDKEVVVFPAFREHALVQKKVFPVKVDISEYEGAMKGTKFINDSGMLQQREKSDKCMVRCSQCSLMMASMEVLDQHMSSVHLDYTGFKCSYCGVYIKAKQKMRYHLTHKHPSKIPKYQPIKQGVPYGNPLNTFDEIVRKKPEHIGVGQRKLPYNNPGLTVSFPFCRPKHHKIGFANIAKKRLSALCSRGYKENTGNLIEDKSLEMRVPTQPTDEEATVIGRSPPKMIKPRSDVVGGTVWLLCNHCSYATLTSTLMRHHVMSHINYRPFRCSYCSFNGVRSYQVKKHIQSMHAKLPTVVKYVTDADIESSLTNHFKMKIRKGSIGDSHIRPYRLKHIPSLNAPLKSKISVRRTTDDCHIPLKKPKIEREDSEEQEVPPEEEPPASQDEVRPKEAYICVICGFRRPTRSSILRHIMWELDYRPWSCPHCEYKDVTLFGVKRHSFQHHPKKPFKMSLNQNPERMLKIQSLVEQSKVQSGPEKPSATVVKQEKVEGSSSEMFGYSNQPGTSQNVYDAGVMMAIPTDSTVITSADQLVAQEKQHTVHHVFRCKDCTFQSPDKNCFKKHILRHGPKRFQCGYCSYCTVFKAELHKHLDRLHKKKPYKIISLADNQVITKKIKTKAIPMEGQLDYFSAQGLSEPARTTTTTISAGLSINPRAEGGVLAQLEAELQEMKSEDSEASGSACGSANDTAATKSYSEGRDSSSKEDAAVGVIDGIALTEEHLKVNAIGEYECQFCDFSSPLREGSKAHVAKHFQLRWKCSHCDTKHRLSYELRRHIRHKHPGLPIKMFRLETDGDFEPKPSVSDLPKVERPDTPKRQASPYNKPGPACSKKRRPNPSAIPSVFCCFHCTFKTNDTVELVAHQKTHAESEMFPKLSGEAETALDDDQSTSSSLSERPQSQPSIENRQVPEHTEDLEGEIEGQNDRVELSAKCGYCSYSDSHRANVINHCRLSHKNRPISVVGQRRVESGTRDQGGRRDPVGAMLGRQVGTRSGSAVVPLDDILCVPQKQLEQLLKVNHLKGIRW